MLKSLSVLNICLRHAKTVQICTYVCTYTKKHVYKEIFILNLASKRKQKYILPK